MVKPIKLILSFFLLILSVNTSSYAEKYDLYSDKPVLDRQKEFLKYDDPEKGEANARLLVEEGVIVLEFLSPAWNLHGIETAPNLRTEEEEEQAKLVVNNFINNRQQYFTFKPADFCSLTSMNYRLEQDQGAEGSKTQANPAVTTWRHFDVRSVMLFYCKDATPEKIVLNVFSAFPRIKKIHLQMLAHQGNLRRFTLTPGKTSIPITRSSSTKDQ